MRRRVGEVDRAVPDETVYRFGEVLKSVTVCVPVGGVGEEIVVLGCVRQSVPVGVKGSRVAAYMDVLDALIDYPDGPTDDLDAVDQPIAVGIGHERIGGAAVDETVVVAIPRIVLVEIGETLVLLDDDGEILYATGHLLADIDVNRVHPPRYQSLDGDVDVLAGLDCPNPENGAVDLDVIAHFDRYGVHRGHTD